MGSRAIGIFIPNVHKIGRHEYLDAFCRRAAEFDLKTMCFSSYTDLFYQDDFDLGEESIYHLAKKADLAAIVIYAELIKNDAVNRMLIEFGNQRGIPVFTIEKKYEGAYYIGYDYDNAFEKITSHVIEEHNAKNIFMISGIKDNEFSVTRNNAYRRALEKHGIPFDESKIYYGEFWEIPTQKVIKQILEECGELPDAIVCANDTMAIAACNALEENGILVPDDIIVTGFDGIERSTQNFPTITTEKLDYVSTVNYIIDEIRRICKGEAINPRDCIFDLSTQLGQSCSCINTSQRLTGKITSQLYDLMSQRQEFRIHMDHMTLSYNNGREIAEIFSEIGRYVSTVIYSGMAIYIDASFFRTSRNGSHDMFLAAYIDPETYEYHSPFTEFRSDGIYSEDILGRYSNLLFVPLHCQDRVYGYVATGYSFLDLMAGDRLADFVVHMNMLLSSIESSAKLSEMVKALNDMYIRDPLTNLLNRRGFYREIDDLVLDAHKNGSEIMIVSVDLDGLKYINDTFGHAEGDFAIKAVADILSEMTADCGICARFGGDEYMAAVVCDADTSAFEKRFKNNLAALNSDSGKEYSVMASVGTEVISSVGTLTSIQEAIKRADDKMFKQKKHSKLSRGFRFGK